MDGRLCDSAHHLRVGAFDSGISFANSPGKRGDGLCRLLVGPTVFRSRRERPSHPLARPLHRWCRCGGARRVPRPDHYRTRLAARQLSAAPSDPLFRAAMVGLVRTCRKAKLVAHSFGRPLCRAAPLYLYPVALHALPLFPFRPEFSIPAPFRNEGILTRRTAAGRHFCRRDFPGGRADSYLLCKQP